ncbi:hypothetical protein [Streptomyces shenzhenensis]|uniref:hypothetical protein n=1 Tax=Streptomyces shenzhenensis TaxID=943815 RepID=UPI0033C1F185
MQTTFVVLELEGPLSVAEAASLLMRRCNSLVDLATDDSPPAQAWSALYALVESERTGTAPEVAPAHDARNALAHLSRVTGEVRAVSGGADRPYGPYGTPDPRTDPEATATFIEAAHQAAIDALSACPTISEEQARLLVADSVQSGRWEMVGRRNEAHGQLAEARDAFLVAARAALDNSVHVGASS